LQYPQAIVLKLFAMGAVQDIHMILPFGLLLAVVLAFGRLYHDNEMVAAQACGLGVGRLHAVVISLALPVALAIGYLTLQLAPRASVVESRLRSEAVRSALAVPFAAGQFRSFNGGKTVVYARSVDTDGLMHEVFIRRNAGMAPEITTAASARSVMTADGLSQTITLSDGRRIEGVPGSARQRIVQFRELRIPVALPAPTTSARKMSEVPTRQLLTSADKSQQAEWQLRSSWPLMALVLAGCAVPLSRLRPRQGRFSRVWLATLCFALYANLLPLAAAWYERSYTPAWLGLWWVHALFAACGVMLAWKARPRRRAG
jgi:lipopolysaccharide export system permease protein